MNQYFDSEIRPVSHNDQLFEQVSLYGRKLVGQQYPLNKIESRFYTFRVKNNYEADTKVYLLENELTSYHYWKHDDTPEKNDFPSQLGAYL